MDKERESEIAKERPIRSGQIQGPFGTVEPEPREPRPVLDDPAPVPELEPIDRFPAPDDSHVDRGV